MIFLDEIDSLKLYKKKLFLPINEKNKRKGSAVFLLTPNYESTKKLLTNPNIVYKWFRSYYIEKDISYFINQEGFAISDDIAYNVLNEAELSNTLKNIKSLNLALKKRIRKPIYRLNNVDPTDPSNSKAQADKVKELTGEKIEDEDKDEPQTTPEFKVGNISEEYVIDELCLRTKDSMIIFNENLDETILNEVDKTYNPILHKMLYKERYRTPREVIAIHDMIKKDIPYINKTFLNYDRYQQLNLFIDLSFYNNTFFNNNIAKLDKAVSLYFEFISRFINDSRLEPAGYTKKTIFIPVDDWVDPKIDKIYRYNKTINPVSVMYRVIEKQGLDVLKKEWKDSTLVFISSVGYFKIEVNDLTDKDVKKIPILLNRLKDKNIAIPDDNKESPKAIVSNIIDKIETSQNVEINDISDKSIKDNKNIPQDLKDELKDNVKTTSKTSEPSKKVLNTKDNPKDLKDELVDKLKTVSKDSESTEEVLDTIDDDSDIKKIIDGLSSQEDNSVKINAVRSARINKLQDEFLDKKLQGTTVRDMISNATNNEEIPKTALNIDSVNEEWKDLHYINFENIYNPNEDIVAMLNSLSTKSSPVMVRNLEIEDSSTTEDYKDTWRAEMEDVNGNRFTLKFDVPKLRENKFMLLGGNEKTISGQLVLLPIIKTDEDTVQVVTNYNKIFIRRFGTSKGKSNVTAGRLLKSLYKDNKLKIVTGDNKKICSKYELPIDYIDMSSELTRIETKERVFYFNQDEIRNKYSDKIDVKKGIPIGVYKKSGQIIYYDWKGIYSNIVLNMILEDDPSFKEVYDTTNVATRYTYAKASILNTEIPLVIVMAHSEGLIKTMEKSNIKYTIQEKRPSYDKNIQDIIRFKDAYILYDLDYNSSLLMNGLKECDTVNYSISEINERAMYLDFLDIFGGRLKSDGLDNFYDMMIDEPITKEILEHYKLPTDYIEVLAYASSLLGDNKYIRHTDQNGRRYRTNEIVAGYTYQAIANSYGDYKNKLKRNPKATMTIKQNEVINSIMSVDPTSSDASTLNPLLELETLNTVSTKGLVGMNSDRGYSLDKRTFDKSMVNVLGLSTGFAGNVGIARQATIDMNIEGKRGYIKTIEDTSNLSVTKSLTITEALTPFGSNMDDPFRTAMTFIQTAKHGMRIENSSPLLITNGSDEALPYLVTDKFAFKAKENGKVIEATDDYLIIEYKSGKKDFIDLRSVIKKNSDGGFYVTLKLDSDYKLNSKFKQGEILAYDKLSFSDKVGHANNIAYNLGTLVKIAIMNTDEGYEDSAIISEYLSESMSSDVIILKDIPLPKDTNIYNMVNIGDPIQEGDPLLIFQNAFDEEDANLLLKNLTGTEEEISDLGRVRVKSKVTGTVEGIKIYKTVDDDELSDSLKKAVKRVEKHTKELKRVMKKYDIDKYNSLDPDYKLDATGKLKKASDGVMIEFYLKYKDRMAVGDKLIYYSALKGVVKDIFPKSKEPYTDFRKDEIIHSLLSIQSVDGRMVGSILLSMAINKTLIELDRSVKTKLGLKFKYLDEE